MEIKEFSMQFAKMCLAFNQEPQEGQILVYYEYLRQYPIDHFAYAVNVMIRGSSFFPKVSELIGEIKNMPPERSNCLQIESKETLPSRQEVRKIIRDLASKLEMKNG